MTVNPRSRSTATKENALDRQEIDQFLAIKQDARMATNRGDGWWHLTPVWYLWDGEAFHHTLGAGRRHLRNLRMDANITICVDEDARLEHGLQAGARSVVCFGTASLSTDPLVVADVTRRMVDRYLGDEGAQYLEPIMAEGRTVVSVTPVSWLTWDYNKD
jgi:PPOX class probable F420-dependent enzyme